MKTVQITSHTHEDGILRLEIPTDMPDRELEILVVIQPVQKLNRPENQGWPPDFFKRTAGIFNDNPLERGEQGEYEIRELLR